MFKVNNKDTERRQRRLFKTPCNFTFFKGCLPITLLGTFFNTSSKIFKHWEILQHFQN